MTRCLMVLLMASCLPGCAAWPEPFARSGPEAGQPGWLDAAGGPYDFGWHLSGDRAAAPLQVFDDGRDTWLQFQPGQPLPALFGVRDGVERLLPYQRRDPYVRVAGVWQGLVLRGGSLTARADYRGENPRGRSALTGGQPLAVAVPGAASGRGEAAAGGAGSGGSAEGVAALAARTADARAGTIAVPPAPPSAASSASRAAPQVLPVFLTADAGNAASASSAGLAAAGSAPVFRATPADANIRRALARWAKSAQWTFEPEHWTPDVDIPLAGSADFPSDFRQAVRQLLAATELSERPLQPCFYSNRVLRVVPLAQACDRTARHAGAAS